MLLFLKKNFPAILILLISTGLLCFFAYFNEYSLGGADNCWHYYFSHYAPKYPEFFLHHWGKPFFILLSTSFSHFGFYGLEIFNILCGISAAIITYKFAEVLKFKYPWYTIILLLFTPLYFGMLQSGMTEPLMSLVLIAAFYFLYTEKFLPATLIMSFSLYTRTEGSFLVLYVFIYLLLIRKWKFIPFLGVGFLVYSIIGKLAGRSFFWFFTENPYAVESPYGHGGWMDFFKQYELIWGLPQVIVLSVSLLLIIMVSILKIKKLNFNNLLPEHKFIILVVKPALIFLLFHVVAWRFGLFGSDGLERVLASVSPFFVLTCSYGIDYFFGTRLDKKISLAFIFILLFFAVKANFKVFTYPLKANYDAKVELEAAKWFKGNYDQNCIVYYAHPGIIFNTDRNPFDKEKNIEQFGLKADSIPVKSLPTYIFWDSQFSESSCGLKLDDLLNSPKVKLIHPLFEDSGFKMYVFEVVKNP